MNQTPLWKIVLIILIMLGGFIYAAPNIYGEDLAVQVSATGSAPVDSVLEAKVQAALNNAKLTAKSLERSENSVLVRFTDTETQLKAVAVIAQGVGEGYTTALNLAPATPKWLAALGGQPMYLGLDLRGGVHFLLAVDTQAAIEQAEERFIADLRAHFREQKIRYKNIARADGGGIQIEYADADAHSAGEKIIGKEYLDLQIQPASGSDGSTLKISEAYLQEAKKFALQQNLTTLRNRVNELGVAEPIVQQQGEDGIVVELPGVQDTARAKDILGATATLEFRMVDYAHDLQEAVAGKVPPASKLYKMRDGGQTLLKKEIMLTGEYITDAASGFDPQSNTPNVSIRLDNKGGALFTRATRDNVGKPMAVVFIENKVKTTQVNGVTQKTAIKQEEVINIATIREELGRSFQITGLDNPKEARNLALLLRAGALAVPVEIIEERTVGPSLGQENIEKGLKSVGLAFLLVVVLMAVYYQVFGLVANVALLMNLVLIIAIMSLLQATLTLPGIAGIVLTLGIAVDANVLINERIREELRNGNTPQSSINAGYERAWGTIFDANITGLIAAVALFAVGTGPIKGFAVTLIIGMLTSMFTAVTISRAIVNLIYGRQRRVTKLAV